MINIRPYSDKDIPFIKSSWMKSYRYGFNGGPNHSVAPIPNTEYYQGMEHTIDKIFMRPDVIGLVAATDKLILGYIICEPRILHYVRLEEFYRKQGIARQLFEAASFDYHKPYYATFWRHKMDQHPVFAKAVFNPFLLVK